VQARTHFNAIPLVRPITRVRIWSRSRASADAFAAWARARSDLVIDVFDTAKDAVAGADIICTATASNTPVLQGAWITPGAHINAVGASAARARELDSNAVVLARLFVDRRESALNESGDFLVPKSEGLVTDDHILAEIGEVLLGRHRGRTSASDITLFKSLGLAIEDLAAAQHIYVSALRNNYGCKVELGGERDAAT
jgi:ornithine cyclodeaminase